MFNPFSSLSGDEHEFAINLASEAVGIVASVIVSVYFASWLDSRSERRKYKRRLAILHDKAWALLEFVTLTLFSNPLYAPSNGTPSHVALWVWRDYEDKLTFLTNHIESVDLEFSGLIDVETSRLLSSLHACASNLYACLALRSQAIHEQVRERKTTSEIVEYHIHWAVSRIVRLIDLADRLASHRRIHAGAFPVDRDEDSLRAKYCRLFEYIIPYAIQKIAREEGARQE
jgi:hypothetical protein